MMISPNPTIARQSESKYDPIEKLARLVAYKQVLSLIDDIEYLSSNIKVQDYSSADSTRLD